jgi:hypothetical protein
LSLSGPAARWAGAVPEDGVGDDIRFRLCRSQAWSRSRSRPVPAFAVSDKKLGRARSLPGVQHRFQEVILNVDGSASKNNQACV